MSKQDTREHMDNGVSVQMSPNDTGAHSNVSQNLSDTREQLEADVYRVADELDAFYCGERFLDTRKIIGWLDRQAAITEREASERHGRFCAECEQVTDGRIAELTAERDTLQGALDIAVQNESKLEAERDELREALDACLRVRCTSCGEKTTRN